MVQKTRLLILACSQRKRVYPALLPAIERYDGPTFRVLRRSLKMVGAGLTDVRILSAEYGLLPPDRLLPIYDRRMTSARARELRSSVVTALNHTLNDNDYNEIFVCVGQIYLQAMGSLDNFSSSTVSIHIATGSLGRRLSELHDWLNGHPPHHDGRQPTAQNERVRIRGVEIGKSPAHAIEIAQRALNEGVDGVNSYQSWYVLVENRRVAPKWLVSQLSGLPVSSFTTGEARRVLTQMGIAVDRVDY